MTEPKKAGRPKNPQRPTRARQDISKKQEGQRLDGYVNSSASWRLKKLADAWGLSIAGVVEQLTIEANEKYSAIWFPEI